MQSIIELLYKGDIRGVSLKLPADRRDKELAYYDKIKALMTGENAKLFDEYADTVALNYEFLIERAYAVAFKTGFLLGLEWQTRRKYETQLTSNDKRGTKGQSILGGECLRGACRKDQRRRAHPKGR